jgi:hypothetical protein
METPVCKCGNKSVRFTVKKNGPNYGRPFFVCADRVCQTFVWADEEESKGTPVCKCRNHSIKLRVKKDGPNQGRYFFKCKTNECNYFQFEEDLEQQGCEVENQSE